LDREEGFEFSTLALPAGSSPEEQGVKIGSGDLLKELARRPKTLDRGIVVETEMLPTTKDINPEG
jgi:hypothetical protein